MDLSSRGLLLASAGADSEPVGDNLTGDVLEAVNLYPIDPGNADNLYGIFLKPDGTRIYTAPVQSNAGIREFALGTPWSLNGSITYLSSTALVFNRLQTGLFFKSDGTRLFVHDDQGIIRQANLSTPWNLGTVGSVSSNNLGTNRDRAIFITPSGNRAFVTGSNGVVTTLNLDTPWNITSLSIGSQFSTNSGSVSGISFNATGTLMYLAFRESSLVRSYSLSTPYDLSTVNTTPTAIVGGVTSPNGLFYRPGELFVAGPQQSGTAIVVKTRLAP